MANKNSASYKKPEDIMEKALDASVKEDSATGDKLVEQASGKDQ